MRFFPLSSPIFALLVFLWGVFWWNFGGFKKPGPSSRWGFARQPESQNVTIEGPGLHKHHQNSTTPRERDKWSKNRVGEGKKRAKFWAVRRKAEVRKRAEEGCPTDGRGGPAETGRERTKHNTQQHKQQHTHTTTKTINNIQSNSNPKKMDINRV